ncbi:MAG: glycosyltransferase [Candidatus Electrothrix sp. EH2]|nr:glycosyltransferase [Candidatus Electrothrix sp. EH2]
MLTDISEKENSVGELPEFSVITACYNGEKYLEKCLDSVSNQTYPHVRHTVIDGGSSDSSVDILRTRSDLHYWQSREDRGIADAFNIGLSHSQGNVIIFLGADDYFHDSDVLAECAAFLRQYSRPWFVYGDIVYEYEDCSRLIKKNYSLRRFKMYNCLPHQAMFLDRYFFEHYGIFDTSYKIAMDYEHLSRFIRNRQPDYWNRTISVMRRIGVSSKPIAAHKEMERVQKKYNLSPWLERYLFFYGIYFYFLFKRYILQRRWS